MEQGQCDVRWSVFSKIPLAEELLRGHGQTGDKVEVMAVDGKLSFKSSRITIHKVTPAAPAS